MISVELLVRQLNISRQEKNGKFCGTVHLQPYIAIGLNWLHYYVTIQIPSYQPETLENQKRKLQESTFGKNQFFSFPLKQRVAAYEKWNLWFLSGKHILVWFQWTMLTCSAVL